MTSDVVNELRGPTCPADEALHDLMDGLLPAERSEEVQRHARSCARCADRLGRIEGLRLRAAVLPREVAPPAGLWTAIQERIGTVPTASDAPLVLHRTASRWRRPALLAAAAVVLMALSSAGTALFLRARLEPARPVAGVVATRQVPAALRAVDAGHLAAVEDLSRSLAERRAELAPETVVAIERSLRIVDQALAEAREALARDPGNAELSDLVAAAYRHKLTVLRRATELAARS